MFSELDACNYIEELNYFVTFPPDNVLSFQRSYKIKNSLCSTVCHVGCQGANKMSSLAVEHSIDVCIYIGFNIHNKTQLNIQSKPYAHCLSIVYYPMICVSNHHLLLFLHCYYMVNKVPRTFYFCKVNGPIFMELTVI